MKVLRTLEGITYWVIEDPLEIAELVNVHIRREWESDVLAEEKDPRQSRWLGSLPSRRWRLEVASIRGFKLNEELMKYKNRNTGYDFSENLQKRKMDLREEIEKYGAIIRPMILRCEDSQLMDGYCRYSTLKDMGIERTYVYVGELSS